MSRNKPIRVHNKKSRPMERVIHPDTGRSIGYLSQTESGDWIGYTPKKRIVARCPSPQYALFNVVEEHRLRGVYEEYKRVAQANGLE